MLSPLAPLYPWLLSAIMFDTPMCARPNGRARLVSIQRTHADGPTRYKFAEHRPTWTSETPDLDLRHGPTRYAVLRALADAGHSRLWALGAPWSPLTDEQAGRVCAEIVRAVGEDPNKPAAVVPVCVLGAWCEVIDGRLWARDTVMASAPAPRPICWTNPKPKRHGWGIAGPEDRTHAAGPETGDAGRLAAETVARALGCIMIEDVTP